MKGFKSFLEIMKCVNSIYPSIPILIIGKGPLASLIKDKYGFLNITYIPFVSNKKIYEIYLKTKIFVECSYSEATPTTILEAMAYKTPVISSIVGGVPDLLEDGINGFLYNLNNPKEAINKIILLLKDENLRTTFAERSFILVKNDFSWNKIIKLHKKIYEKLLNQ